jgi:hypothetical protein
MQTEVDRQLLEYVVQQMAPEELPFLDSILEPEQSASVGAAEPALAFGISLPPEFMTSTVLMVLKALYDAIGVKLLSAGVDLAKDVLSARIKKWLDQKNPTPAVATAKSFTLEQIGTLRAAVIEVAAAKGMDAKNSTEFADAMTGYFVSRQ